MDCPRCGTRLTRISLNGEFQSVYCERCRFADVESDHTRASDGEETWDDALRRFRTAHVEGNSDGGGDAEAGSEAAGDAEARADADADSDAGNSEDGDAADSDDGDAETEEA